MTAFDRRSRLPAAGFFALSALVALTLLLPRRWTDSSPLTKLESMRVVAQHTILKTPKPSLRPLTSIQPKLVPNLPQFLQTCIEKQQHNDKVQLHVPYERLPKLGIVVTTSADKVDLAVSHNVESWAHRHGYYYHEAVIDQDDWLPVRTSNGTEVLRSFFTARWNYVQHRVWGRYQWVLHLDGDNMVGNMGRNIDQFLERLDDVVLHMSTNHEVAAGIALFRSTLVSYCFLEWWVGKGLLWEETHRNWDNGDLIQ